LTLVGMHEFYVMNCFTNTILFLLSHIRCNCCLSEYSITTTLSLKHTNFIIHSWERLLDQWRWPHCCEGELDGLGFGYWGEWDSGLLRYSIAFAKNTHDIAINRAFVRSAHFFLLVMSIPLNLYRGTSVSEQISLDLMLSSITAVLSHCLIFLSCVSR